MGGILRVIRTRACSPAIMLQSPGAGVYRSFPLSHRQRRASQMAARGHTPIPFEIKRISTTDDSPVFADETARPSFVTFPPTFLAVVAAAPRSCLAGHVCEVSIGVGVTIGPYIQLSRGIWRIWGIRGSRPGKRGESGVNQFSGGE